jgi:hypothetical protein
MTDPRVLLQKAQAQTQGNRYVFLLRTANDRIVRRIANSK